MTSYTAGRLKNLVNSKIESFNRDVNSLFDHLMLVSNFNGFNKLFTIEVNNGSLVLKSKPFEFYPSFEGKLVTDGESVFWRGQFYHLKTNEEKIPLSCFYIDIHGRVSVNSTTEWDFMTESDELFALITSSLFDAAISKKLITP